MDTVICVAAGLSSRMGAFKPMLPLGDSTIIRMLIDRYRKSGVEQVVLVTGRKADELEEHVRDLDVMCRRNHRFAQSDMLASIKIGMRTYVEDGADPSEQDRILITPCDIPLFHADTIKLLVQARDAACAPAMEGRRGHPLCLSRQALEQILPYEGEGGLACALKDLGIEVAEIPVDDPGILLDADTPEDYERLKHLFAKRYGEHGAGGPSPA